MLVKIMEESDLEWAKHIAKICHGKKVHDIKLDYF